MATIIKECLGGTIEFDYKVQNQDVFACQMTRGKFNEITKMSLEGDPDEPGYAYLIREQTTLRWSSNPTGTHHKF